MDKTDIVAMIVARHWSPDLERRTILLCESYMGEQFDVEEFRQRVFDWWQLSRRMKVGHENAKRVGTP